MNNPEIIKYALTFLLSNLEPDVVEDLQDYMNISHEELEIVLQKMIDDCE